MTWLHLSWLLRVCVCVCVCLCVCITETWPWCWIHLWKKDTAETSFNFTERWWVVKYEMDSFVLLLQPEIWRYQMFRMTTTLSCLVTSRIYRHSVTTNGNIKWRERANTSRTTQVEENSLSKSIFSTMFLGLTLSSWLKMKICPSSFSVQPYLFIHTFTCVSGRRDGQKRENVGSDTRKDP